MGDCMLSQGGSQPWSFGKEKDKIAGKQQPKKILENSIMQGDQKDAWRNSKSEIIWTFEWVTSMSLILCSALYFIIYLKHYRVVGVNSCQGWSGCIYPMRGQVFLCLEKFENISMLLYNNNNPFINNTFFWFINILSLKLSFNLPAFIIMLSNGMIYILN